MTQDQLKTLVAQAALEYIYPNCTIGVGTGSTVNKFIDALAGVKHHVRAAVSSSNASTQRLEALGIAVLPAETVDVLDVYIDGADEIDPNGYMIKGGGGALTREKIVAAQSKQFICIADASKQVEVLGDFPLPIEIIPMAAAQITRQLEKLGGNVQLRMQDQAATANTPYITDNGMHILDVNNLRIHNPLEFENTINQIPGIITVGVFAQHKAHVCLLGTKQGVQKISFS